MPWQTGAKAPLYCAEPEQISWKRCSVNAVGFRRHPGRGIIGQPSYRLCMSSKWCALGVRCGQLSLIAPAVMQRKGSAAAKRSRLGVHAAH